MKYKYFKINSIVYGELIYRTNGVKCWYFLDSVNKWTEALPTIDVYEDTIGLTYLEPKDIFTELL